MQYLKFDYESMFRDVVDEVLVKSANEAMRRFYDTVKSGLKKISSGDVEIKEAHRMNAFASEYKDTVKATVVTYGMALLESYGKGTEWDWNNESLDAYIGGKLWNPIRHSSEIVGREEGSYTNFFGDVDYSKGTMAKKKTGGKSKPTYVIQNAEKSLFRDGGYVERILKANMEEFVNEIDTSKYFKEAKR